MRLVYRLPEILPGMTTARIERIHAKPGDALALGHKLIDLRIDLSGGVKHDCPPITFFRLVMRERAWLQQLDVRLGEDVAVGSPFAWFTISAEELADCELERAVRIAHTSILAPIVQPAEWFDN